MTDSRPVVIVPHKHPLSSVQLSTLNAMTELMIPASSDGRMPAASALELFAEMNDLPPATIDLLGNGLKMLEVLAQEQYGKAFVELDTPQAMATVDSVRAKAPKFVHAFTLHTTARYYQHDQVLPLIGLEVRPPWPEGNQVEEGDWSLLDPVRERDKFYRDA